MSVPAAVAVGFTPIVMFTLAEVAIRATLAPNGALPLCAEVPVDVMFSLDMIREARWFCIS